MGVLLVPGLLGALLSPMFFDAPGSMDNPAAWMNALIVLSFPALCILSIVGTWIAWLSLKRGSKATPRAAQVVLACLPLLPVTYFVGAMVLQTVGLLVSGQPMGLHTTIIKP